MCPSFYSFPRMGWLASSLSLALANMTVCAFAGDEYNNAAHFRVTSKVINPDIRPITATISGVGNSLIEGGGSFEPVVMRTKYIAAEDSPDRIVADSKTISQFDTLREGVLDGAEVFVYRIEDGKFVRVRIDRVAPQGFHASGWLPLLKPNQVVPPDITSFRFRWPRYYRPKVPCYFTVRAVDSSGNLSRAAKAVAFERPSVVDSNVITNPIVSRALNESRSSVALGRQIETEISVSALAPVNLRGAIQSDGTLALKWQASNDPKVAGYVVYRSDYPPDAHRGYFLQLANSPKNVRERIQAGDMVFVSKKIYTPSRRRFHSNRVWGAHRETKLLKQGLLKNFPDETGGGLSWELVAHEKGTPVEEPGETFLRFNSLGDTSKRLSTFNHSGTQQSWYEVLQITPYRIEVWLRTNQPGKARFRLEGFYSEKNHRIPDIVFEPTSTWRKYSATFTPPSVQGGEKANSMALEFTGVGQFDVDNFRIFREDTQFLDYTEDDYAELRSASISFLRTHAFIKTGLRTYDLEQLTNSGGVVNGTANQNTLPQTLAIMRNAMVAPWLQIEPHFTLEEWQGFLEYIAAPYDPDIDTRSSKPWAFKRYSQGQKGPWTDEFDRLLLELGNETWNRLFLPWTFSGATDAITGKRYTAGDVYGLYQEHVVSNLKSSPYWAESGLDEKVEFVLGGWSRRVKYGGRAAAMSPSSQHLTIAAYNGGWDEGEGPASHSKSSAFNVLNQVSQSAIPAAKRLAGEVAVLNRERQHIINMGTYEAGPGYALNGLNGAKVTKEQAAQQEQVMKSLAAGTATLDSFLARSYRGFDLQNFFTFDRGDYWKSHAEWYRGGQAHPSWKVLSLFNRIGIGDMLATETVEVPMIDLKAAKRRQAVANAPLVAVYATRKGDRLVVILVSRKVPNFPHADDDGFTPIKVDLPIKSAEVVRLYRMTGNPMANNVLSNEVRIEGLQLEDVPILPFEINAATGASDFGLPPASTFFYIFDGVSE